MCGRPCPLKFCLAYIGFFGDGFVLLGGLPPLLLPEAEAGATVEYFGLCRPHEAQESSLLQQVSGKNRICQLRREGRHRPLRSGLLTLMARRCHEGDSEQVFVEGVRVSSVEQQVLGTVLLRACVSARKAFTRTPPPLPVGVLVPVGPPRDQAPPSLNPARLPARTGRAVSAAGSGG